MKITGGLSKHLECEYCKNPWFKRETEVVLSDEQDAIVLRTRTIYTCAKCGQKEIVKEFEQNG